MNTILLTTHDSTRTEGAYNHLLSHGFDADIFYAIKNDDAKTSFNISMQHITSQSDGILWFFEDDVYLKDSGHLHDAINQIPSDWEMLYLGANLVAPIQRHSDNLFRTFGAWTTHAVCFNNAKALCEAYQDTTQMFDDWLKDNIHPRGKSYIVSPMIAWQKPHESPLWNHYADYTDIFNASANKLM